MTLDAQTISSEEVAQVDEEKPQGPAPQFCDRDVKAVVQRAEGFLTPEAIPKPLPGYDLPDWVLDFDRARAPAE